MYKRPEMKLLTKMATLKEVVPILTGRLIMFQICQEEGSKASWKRMRWEFEDSKCSVHIGESRRKTEQNAEDARQGGQETGDSRPCPLPTHGSVPTALNSGYRYEEKVSCVHPGWFFPGQERGVQR